MKTVLVTGGTGFIGRHCVATLLRRGWEVHVLAPEDSPARDAGVFFHKGNLLDTGQTGVLVRTVQASHLLHLAWNVTPGGYAFSPENLTWVQASLALLEHFHAAGGRRVVTAGTCFEYDLDAAVLREDMTADRPQTIYGCCKQALGQLTRAFCQCHDMGYGWARVFYLYGPGEHPGRLAAAVITALLQGQRAPCTEGRQVRDYLHVADVAQGLVALLESDFNGVVNLGSGVPVAVRELVSVIARQLDAQERVDFGALPTRAHEPPVILADTRRLREVLHWQPHFTLEAGIADTIAWWRDRLQQRSAGS